MKKFLALVAIAMIILIGWMYVNREGFSGDKNFENQPRKKNMILQVTSNADSAVVRYYELERESVQSIVTLPWTKTVFTASTKITATRGVGGNEIACEIIDGSSGRVLDKETDDDVAVCNYSTF